MDGKKVVRVDSGAILSQFHQKELLFKILVIGDYGVGKSGVVRYKKSSDKRTYRWRKHFDAH